MNPTIEWLLEGDPWVVRGTQISLLHKAANEPAAVGSRQLMIEHPFICNLVDELQEWPGRNLVSHKSAGHLLHKIVFAADIGLTWQDPGMETVVSRILEHQDVDGPLQMRSMVPVHFGGTGEETWGWTLCDAPLVLYALVRLGLADHPQVQQGVEHIVSLVRGNGWPCVVSKEMGSFRGPGRKSDPCPYATLIMLKLLAHLPGLRDGEAAHAGAEALLSAWQNRASEHAYMFYMGTDFCKLKAPLVWYDILHVAEVLTHFRWLQDDLRLLEMMGVIRTKADAEGRFTPESVWMSWKNWEFGQKKVPSRWLTLIANQVLDRIS